MVILCCPNCGERNIQEFRFGGEAHSRPPDPSAVSDEEWADYLYMKDNRRGEQLEWWCHRAGCGLWFLAKRHTYSNQVETTYEFEA